MLTRLLLAITLVATLPAAGSAGLITFTDRAAWPAAAGTPTATENFQGFTQDTFYYPNSVPANGFSISASGPIAGGGLFGNKVEVAPFAPPFGSTVSPNGTNFLWGHSSTTPTMSSLVAPPPSTSPCRATAL